MVNSAVLFMLSSLLFDCSLKTGPELPHRQEKLSKCVEELRAVTVEIYAIFARCVESSAGCQFPPPKSDRKHRGVGGLADMSP